MGRYRPPAQKKSPYITARGFESLRREEKALWLRRREVTQALAAAAAEALQRGDGALGAGRQRRSSAAKSSGIPASQNQELGIPTHPPGHDV